MIAPSFFESRPADPAPIASPVKISHGSTIFSFFITLSPGRGFWTPVSFVTPVVFPVRPFSCFLSAIPLLSDQDLSHPFVPALAVCASGMGFLDAEPYAASPRSFVLSTTPRSASLLQFPWSRTSESQFSPYLPLYPTSSEFPISLCGCHPRVPLFL